MTPSIFLLLALLLGALPLEAQRVEIPSNHDEASVPSYSLPPVLRMSDGQWVEDAQTWWERRRPEIVRFFEHEMYGIMPGALAGMTFETLVGGPRGARQ